MTETLPTLIATSVIRGSQQGESHGGIYTVDFERRQIEQRVDWNTGEIDFEGRGADRGLRGICFDGDDIYVAASDELFRYDRDFKIVGSYRNRYLKHCHEISRHDGTILLSSTGFDSLLAFDIGERDFVWGMQIQRELDKWIGRRFDPRSSAGPVPSNSFHINMVHVDQTGLYCSGLRTRALLYIDAEFNVREICNLPRGTHNAQPFADGVLFNDTANDHLRYVPRDGQAVAIPIRHYPENEIEFAGIDDSRVARQGFARGLCTVDAQRVAGGSSPSTISLYDIGTGKELAAVNLTMDIRNAIHGLEVWPYG